MSVDSLAPLRFAIAANLAGRIHGELNGVQPDAGASALFAAQQFAAENQAAQNAAASSFDSPNPQADPWEPTAQQVHTGAYPSYQPAASYQPAPETGYETAYAAGSELDYGSGQGSGQQGYGTGTYAAAPVAHPAPTAYAPAAAHAPAAYAPPTAAPAGAHAAAPAAAGPGPQGGSRGYDYEDNSHTVDSGQFSQYIADQYNTGQVAAVDYLPAPVQPKPRQDGRWSYA
jgi:hypothetical protein